MEETKPRILVVYFSRSGTTRDVAHRLGALLGADLEEIEDPTPRSGWLGFLRCGYEAQRRQLPTIAPANREPGDYDIVVVGTPVWVASVSSPVRAYLRKHRGALRSAAFFCTCGGSGGRRALEQMEEECGRPPVVRMQLRQDDIGTVTADLAVERFVTRILAAPAVAAGKIGDQNHTTGHHAARG